MNAPTQVNENARKPFTVEQIYANIFKTFSGQSLFLSASNYQFATCKILFLETSFYSKFEAKNSFARGEIVSLLRSKTKKSP